MTESVLKTSHGNPLSAPVSALAGVIMSPHYPSADRAALRRWSSGQPIPLTFYRLWIRHISTDLPTASQMPYWMALAWGMAVSPHDGQKSRDSWGTILAEIGFSEGRLERLLSSPEALRIDLFMPAIRFHSAKNVSPHWLEAAHFLLTHDPDKREGVCRRIASDFYRHYIEKE